MDIICLQAFTLSLTDWANRKFKGGETMMLQPHVLNYWYVLN
jgi:hypothetical protein